MVRAERGLRPCVFGFDIQSLQPTGSTVYRLWSRTEEAYEASRKGFVLSLCYLKALKLYNAKQVPFFFIYG